MSRRDRAQRREARRQAKHRRGGFVGISIALVVVLLGAGLIYARITGRRSERFVVDVGDHAPDFSLVDANRGETLSLEQLRGRSRVLLFFFEGIMCQPCWDQLRDFERVDEEFRKLGIEVVGVTVDPLRPLAAKTRQEGLGLPVLFDGGARVSRQYDTLAFGSMHPGQRPGHTFILVGREGTVLWRQDFREMYVPVHVVLQDLRSVN